VEQKKQFEKNLLQTIGEQEQKEVQKQSELKNKIYQQKLMRDMQLQEAKYKKEVDNQ
jgi:hypothetical protein